MQYFVVSYCTEGQWTDVDWEKVSDVAIFPYPIGGDGRLRVPRSQLDAFYGAALMRIVEIADELVNAVDEKLAMTNCDVAETTAVSEEIVAAIREELSKN